jgi:hypothetical protein
MGKGRKSTAPGQIIYIESEEITRSPEPICIGTLLERLADLLHLAGDEVAPLMCPEIAVCTIGITVTLQLLYAYTIPRLGPRWHGCPLSHPVF